MEKVDEVCRAYRNTGRCRFGDDCKYVHSEGPRIEPPPRGKCFAFEEGTCDRGASCRFSHGPEEDAKREAALAQEVCRNYQRGHCKNENCPRKHVEAEEPTEKPKRSRARKKKTKKPGAKCYDFEENGTCDRGDECKFRHGDNDPRFPAQIANAPAGESTGRKRASRRRGPRTERTGPIEEEECQNYLNGRCRFGKDCRRKHVGDVEQVPVQKIDEVCNNFLAGRCHFAEHCRRQHPAGQGGTQQVSA